MSFRFIFLTDWGMGKVFSIKDIATVGKVAVLADGLKWVNGLTIDRKNYKVYWGDAYHDV